MQTPARVHSGSMIISGGNVWRLISRYPFVPATQQLSRSSDDKNGSAALWVNHPWNVE